jgi:hypothetical protein
LILWLLLWRFVSFSTCSHSAQFHYMPSPFKLSFIKRLSYGTYLHSAHPPMALKQ